MASNPESKQHVNVEASSFDALDTFINNSGCAEFHFKLQECFADTKDWRKCQKEVKEFRYCVNETSSKTKKPRTEDVKL